MAQSDVYVKAARMIAAGEAKWRVYAFLDEQLPPIEAITAILRVYAGGNLRPSWEEYIRKRPRRRQDWDWQGGAGARKVDKRPQKYTRYGWE